jgi:hypothetical protein
MEDTGVIQAMVIVSMETIIINHTIKKAQVIVQEVLIMQSVWVHMVTITIINLHLISINKKVPFQARLQVVIFLILLVVMVVMLQVVLHKIRMFNKLLKNLLKK